MIKKLAHYVRRFAYHRRHRMLPTLEGGNAAGGQDLLLAELLGHKTNGFFVDIGANDGKSISNSWHFEKNLGWQGIAVEPVPAIFRKLQANRNCELVHGCVAPQAGTAKFLEVVGQPNMLSTLAIHNANLTARRLRKNVERQNATIREIEVQCYTFQSLVEQYGIKEIDLLSVDTEGGELEILMSIDFKRTPVRTITVENNFYTRHLRNYLESQGFLYQGTFGVDEIYLFGGQPLRETTCQAA
jgi:FkbM family methyltransferase